MQVLQLIMTSSLTPTKKDMEQNKYWQHHDCFCEEKLVFAEIKLQIIRIGSEAQLFLIHLI